MGRNTVIALALRLKYSIADRKCKVASTIEKLILKSFCSTLCSLKVDVVLKEQGGE